LTTLSPIRPHRLASTPVDYAALRAEVPIRWVLERIHFKPLSVSGDQWRGACPLPSHASYSEREKTFSVNVRRNIYQCFGCKCAGNQIHLWAELTQLPYEQAARDLYRVFRGNPVKPGICNPHAWASRTTPPATPGT